MKIASLILTATLGLSAQVQAPAPFDGLVDIGGRRLHLVCSGTGSPTVVLEHGLNTSATTWDAVVPTIAKDTRVCAYDRAGVRTSDQPPTKPRTGRDAAADLYALIRASNMVGPFVLVGHSIGGAIIRLFAQDHPDFVAGLVLVDSTNEYEFQLDRPISSGEWMDTSATVDQLRADHWQRDVPLYVLAAGRENVAGASETQLAQIRKYRLAMQEELARRSPKGHFIVAERSGHNVPLEQPQVVIDAIRSAVNDVRALSQ